MLRLSSYLRLILAALAVCSAGLAWATVEVCEKKAVALAIEALSDRQPQIDLPLPKFGIEVEGSIPSSLGLGHFANLLKDTLEARGQMVRVEVAKGNYRILASRVEPSGVSIRVWRIEADMSVVPENPYVTENIELVSPILESSSDFDDFKAVLALFESKGFRSEPRSAGVHVHVDFGGAKPEELLQIVSAFALFENEMKVAMATRRERTPWIKATSYVWTHMARAYAHEKAIGKFDPQEVWKFLNHLSVSEERRRLLNPMAFRKYGTVEFRLFNSTTDAVAIDGMQDFCRRFVRAIRGQDPRLIRYIVESEGDVQFRKVAELVGAKWGQDFDNAMRRIQDDTQAALMRGARLDAEEFAPRKKKSGIGGLLLMAWIAFAIAPEEGTSAKR